MPCGEAQPTLSIFPGFAIRMAVTSTIGDILNKMGQTTDLVFKDEDSDY